MPPQVTPPPIPNIPPAPQPKKTGVGPTVGIVIIIILLVFGALYFWGARLNQSKDPLPLIPGDATSTY